MKVIIVFSVVMLISSCGTCMKVSESEEDDILLQKDSVEVKDTFVPLHPPVVVPHSWRDAK